MARDSDLATGHRVTPPHVMVLLIEDNLAEARFLQELLKGALHRFEVIHVQRLRDALQSLSTQPIDVILLDLTLPDSYGLASIDALIQSARPVPIVVLTNTNDDELAVEAVRHGAQDYLVKRQIHQDPLVRSLRYAIERKQAAEALREANEILELRVQERTTALKTANELLTKEIAQRQRTQERLELAQKAGQIGSFEWDIPANSITWTAELEALYGLQPGDLHGRYTDWLATLHPDDRPKVEQELQEILIPQQRRSTFDSEFRILWPNGEVHWIIVKSSIFYDEFQNPLRMIGIHMDITEKKQLEAQFLRAQRLESLGNLASGIAHDLNNILTPILAVVQLLPLKLPTLDAHTQQMLKMLEASAHRGAELVKQILAFARGSDGDRVRVSILPLLQEIEQLMQQTFPKTIALQIDIPENLATIVGDATQLHQVFMNLCVNARDAMPEGGTLRISAQRQWVDPQTSRCHWEAHPGDYIVITIADTGTGVPSDILPHIFDPFFTTKASGKGTGLGLSAVLSIVKRHGGFVDVQSTVNQGSQFHLYFPIAPSNEEPTNP